MLCKNCNAKINDNDMFCGYCGYNLTNKDEYTESDELNEVNCQPTEYYETQHINQYKENNSSKGKKNN